MMIQLQNFSLTSEEENHGFLSSDQIPDQITGMVDGSGRESAGTPGK